ncbi:MAG: hypothetical protein M1812_005933 [Candelaria pacifica]|nr:MAG: hypothetical protein M1812_005933 [Candelaria pacifica]
MVERSKKPSAIPVSPIGPSPQVEITSDSSRVSAKLPTGESIEILLYGATVISWKSGGKENLFLSDKTHLDGSKAVRGGIPLVFPVFGPPPSNHPTSNLPQHGFARNARWEYLGKSTSESNARPNSTGDDSVKLDFGLEPSSLGEESRKAWPYNFGLVYSVTLSREGLGTSMMVRNEGQEAFSIQFLLHTYFKVKDIGAVTISGLKECTYIDKVDSLKEKSETSENLTITSEIDRVYSVPSSRVLTISEDKTKRFEIQRDNLDNVVVWNPWIEKAGSMSDFGPEDGWKRMICVEAGSVSGWQKLEPGDTYDAGQSIKAY